MYKCCEDCTFAVRSSGASEDGAHQSFAGQFDTILNVSGIDAICTALKTCWASVWTGHVANYITDDADELEPLPMMAVVIQVQVLKLFDLHWMTALGPSCCCWSHV